MGVNTVHCFKLVKKTEQWNEEEISAQLRKEQRSVLSVFYLDKTFLMNKKVAVYLKPLPLLLYSVSPWIKSEGPEAAVKTPPFLLCLP